MKAHIGRDEHPVGSIPSCPGCQDYRDYRERRNRKRGIQKLGGVLGMFTERLVDRATDAGHPPNAGVVLELKERGLLKPDNEVTQVTRDMLEDDDGSS